MKKYVILAALAAASAMPADAALLLYSGSVTTTFNTSSGPDAAAIEAASGLGATNDFTFRAVFDDAVDYLPSTMDGTYRSFDFEVLLNGATYLASSMAGARAELHVFDSSTTQDNVQIHFWRNADVAATVPGLEQQAFIFRANMPNTVLTSDDAPTTAAFFSQIQSVAGNFEAYLSHTSSTHSVYHTRAAGASGTLNIGPAVPEPATWAMMIAGFGLVGGAMRSRRRGTLALG